MNETVVLKHINLPVRELDTAVDFYRDVLGFQYVKHLSPRKVVLEFNGFDFFLEHDDDSRVSRYFHFGFKTTREQLFAWADHLTALGITVMQRVEYGLIPTPPPLQEDVARFYFRDPDGWLIEVYHEV
ncbi:MAG TPA: VOC family protein [Thermoanaerobaculia bacterium]|jgi:catechol 2,3-dioxygenase-like lactoylglutathione lyase family enzyme|nr:VOC family protein [Thermoanaerobaculia bacterium]